MLVHGHRPCGGVCGFHNYNHVRFSWTRAVASLLAFAKTSFAPWPLRLIAPEPAAFLPLTNRWPRAWSGMQGRVISVNSAVVADGGGGDYGDYWEL